MKSLYKRNKVAYYCLYILIGCSMLACSKMNGTYKNFIKNGAIIYPGKADSLMARSGNGRIELSWILTDPKVKKCLVYWNHKLDSLIIPIDKVKGIDTIHIIINNLKAGAYTFELYTYDEEGHQSVNAETTGIVYGDEYKSSLVNRFVKNMSVVNGKVVIQWTTPDDGAIGETINYTDKQGNIRNVFVPVDDSAVLAAFKPGNTFNYKTLYLPDSLAIDTFYSPSQTVIVEAKLFQIMLDKSLFKAVHLPTDTYKPHGSNNTMDKIWDGILNAEGPSFLTDPGSGFPQWFTFDLGVKAQLSRMKYYQRGTSSHRLFHGGNIKKFEIWGSNDPNPNGAWDSTWTLLLTCKSKKPSGLPPGETTQGDIDYALAGEEFVFPDTIPAVRYIRIKTFENWDTKNRTYVNIGELTFWASQVE